MRIGLVSDSHISRRGELWPQVFDVFRGVDAILHAGDLWSPTLLEELGAVAPVWAARGNGDLGVEDERVRDTWVLEFAGTTVAMIHDFPSPERASPAFIAKRREQRFPGADPRIVVYGHSHIEEAAVADGVLYVNPGSPTLPHNKSVRLGTIGFLTLSPKNAAVELHQLTETGSSPVHRAQVSLATAVAPAAGA